MRLTLESNGVREFQALLMELIRLHEELVVVQSGKLAAVRAANLAALREHSEHESTLIRRLSECDGRRKRLIVKLGAPVGLSAAQARTISMSNLSAYLTENDRQLLHPIVEELRAAVKEAARIHSVTATTTRVVLEHLHWTWTAVVPKDSSGPSYRPDGTVETGQAPRLMEWVG